jgi:hypothetical protein
VAAVNTLADGLYGRMLAERPQRTPARLDATAVITLVEAAYAEQMRWRKTRGISAPEVAM